MASTTAIAHVVVQLVDRDHPVIVPIGGAGLEAVDQEVGEQGRLRVADDAVALPGVLRGIGGGEDHPSEPGAFERFRSPDADALRGFGAVGKRAAVAAVEHEHLPLRKTAVHSTGDERRLNRASRQQRALRVAQRQIEVSLVVLDAVPGEVEQQEIVSPSPVVESRDGLADRRTTFVQECRDLIELTDVRGLEDFFEALNVQIGSLQTAQVGVVVVTVADDESELRGHRLLQSGHAPTARALASLSRTR